jgi:hypothetical protein
MDLNLIEVGETTGERWCLRYRGVERQPPVNQFGRKPKSYIQLEVSSILRDGTGQDQVPELKLHSVTAPEEIDYSGDIIHPWHLSDSKGRKYVHNTFTGRQLFLDSLVIDQVTEGQPVSYAEEYNNFVMTLPWLETSPY